MYNMVTKCLGDPCVNNKGYQMYNADAISILNCAFDTPCVFCTWGLEVTFPKVYFPNTSNKHRLNIIQTSSKHHPNII